jgi:SulP family sulfate permease
MLFAGKWAAYIPMPTLAGILVVVAYNMSEWHSFRSVLKGPRSDVAILLITFLLTVLVDLTAAIGIGMVLAAFLFMRKMIQSSAINLLTNQPDGEEGDHEISGRNALWNSYPFSINTIIVETGIMPEFFKP